MPGDISDMNAYLVSISKRIAALEVDSYEAERDVLEQGNDIRETKANLDKDAIDLRSEIRSLRSEITELSAQVTVMLQSFKRLARKEAFGRLNRKVDSWSPEKLATHADLEWELKKLYPKVYAYCVKCKEKTKMIKPEEVEMKNGRLAWKGNCSTCKTGTYVITGNS